MAAPILMTDIAEGQKAALQMQYSPDKYKREAASEEIDAQIKEDAYKDYKGTREGETAILQGYMPGESGGIPTSMQGKLGIGTAQAGGYEAPEVTKLNDIIQAKQTEVATQTEEKDKFIALAKNAAINHNPKLAESYRAKAKEVDQNSREATSDGIKLSNQLDERLGRLGASYLENPSNENWTKSILQGASEGVIPHDEALQMMNAPQEMRERIANAAISQAKSTEIRSKEGQSAIKMERQARMDTERTKYYAWKQESSDRKENDSRNRISAKATMEETKYEEAKTKDYLNTIDKSAKHAESALRTLESERTKAIAERLKIDSGTLYDMPLEEQANRRATLNEDIAKLDDDIMSTKSEISEYTTEYKETAKKLGKPAKEEVASGTEKSIDKSQAVSKELITRFSKDPATTGMTLGKRTSSGWEVKDAKGTTIGYYD